MKIQISCRINIVEKTSILINGQQNVKGLKVLTPKQMFQRLPIAFAQLKAGHTSENLLNGICQIIYSLYRAKEITKKVYKNVMNSIKLQNKMDAIYTNPRNNKTSDPHRLFFNLLDKISLKKSAKYVALSNLSMYNNGSK